MGRTLRRSRRMQRMLAHQRAAEMLPSRASAIWLSGPTSLFRLVSSGASKALIPAVLLMLFDTSTAVLSELFPYLLKFKLAVIGVLSEFNFVMDALNTLYFELPIMVLWMLIAENLIGIFALFSARVQGLKILLMQSFRFIDMSRDLWQLRDDYGFFRWFDGLWRR